MDKQFLINEINNLVVAHRLWSGINSHIFALSQGSIWETEYSYAHLYHAQLVFRLIIASREENKEYEDLINSMSFYEIPKDGKEAINKDEHIPRIR